MSDFSKLSLACSIVGFIEAVGSVYLSTVDPIWMGNSIAFASIMAISAIAFNLSIQNDFGKEKSKS